MFYLYRKLNGHVISISEKPFEIMVDGEASVELEQKKDLFPPLIYQDGTLRLATFPEIDNFPQAEFTDNLNAEKKRVKQVVNDDSAAGVFAQAYIGTLLYELNLLRKELGVGERAEADVRTIFMDEVDKI